MLKSILRHKSSFMASAVMLLAFSCSLNIFPDSEDMKLGKQVDEEIRKNPKEYPILAGRPDVKAYVAGIGNKILAAPAIQKKGVYAYQYEVIANDSVINAFCTPGGYIYVYTGLMKFIDDEATLAGVIGHEIAHAERRHATKRMTKTYGAQILLGLVLGEKPSQVAEITANLFTGLALLANSRSDETEADEFSIKYLSSTPYYPGAITSFFKKMQGKKGGKTGGSLERFLSTHPLDEDRIKHVQDVLGKMGNPAQNEMNTFNSKYQEFKKKL